MKISTTPSQSAGGASNKEQLLSVSDETVRRMIRAGQLDGVKVRGTWRIRRESLEKYLNP